MIAGRDNPGRRLAAAAGSGPESRGGGETPGRIAALVGRGPQVLVLGDASGPVGGHGSVRLALLARYFPCGAGGELGRLDLCFSTRSSLVRPVEAAGGEFHAAVRYLTAELHTVVSHRDHLEARLIRLRNSSPGRAYRAARTLPTFVAWR